MIAPERLRLVAVSPDLSERRARLVADLEALAAGGVTAFMFREKGLDDRDFVTLGRELRTACDRLGLAFILNERVALAEPIGAAIVHLTWRSGPAAAVREARSSGMVLGRSLHAEEELRDESLDLLDYLVYGPIFPTPSKEGLVAARGTESLARLVAATDLPVVAIGGMVAGRAAEIRRAGAAGLAAIRALFSADPRGSARAMSKAWEDET